MGAGLAAANQSHFSCVIYSVDGILPLYFYNVSPNHKILIMIMIKRFTQALFLQSRTSLYGFSSAPKAIKTVDSAEKDIKATKLQSETLEDDAQPQYQKEDRTTPGWILYRLLFWGSAAVLGYNTYLVAQHDKKTPVEEETGAFPGFITAAKIIHNGYADITEFLTKPPLDKLLPDVVHPLIQPKTLVLNLSGTLLQTQYVFGKGLIVNKRPGLQQFLQKMSQLYQVIIFSDDDPMLISTLSSSLDPRRNMISNYFGKECMVLSRGHYIKDLKYLNRDLSKVIVIDKSKKIVDKQRENVITLSQYNGNQGDRELMQLSSLLESMAKPEIKDVRKTLQEMGQDPLKFYEQSLKQKQQKIKSTQNSHLFSFFDRKN